MQVRGRLTVAVVAVVVVCATAATAANAGAAVLTVTTTQDNLTSGDHQCTLREAIAAVDTPGSLSDCGMADSISNTIVLPASSQPYALSINPNPTDDNTTGDLDVTATSPPLTISGAGVTKTIVSGTALKDRIMHVIPGATVTIKDLTLTGARAPNGTDGQNGINGMSPTPPTAGTDGFPGGGLRNGGTLTLDDVAVTNNAAGSGGKGGTGLTLSAGTKGGNGGAGGGIENAGHLTLTNVTVSGNVAGDGGRGGNGGDGGSGGTGATGGCCGDGGGLANDGGTVVITGSTFSGNHAGAGGGGGAGGSGVGVGTGGAGGAGQGGSSGGAIASNGGSVTITNSTLSGNVTGVGGDGGNGGPDAVNSSIPKGGNAGNGSAGGGVFAHNNATVTLVNVTGSGNQVGGPGTPGTRGSGSTASNGIAGNPAFGGGIYGLTPVSLAAQNTLLAANELGNCAGTITDGGHNLSAGVSTGCPVGFTAIGDALLGPLQDNGGPTQTIAPSPLSPAVDKINPPCQLTDQRGLPRPSGAKCDIGAYEVTPPAVTPPATSAITTTSATVAATATADTGTANVHFEFGTTTAYGSNTPTSAVTGLASQPVSASLAGLAPNTTYHVRLVATSTDGTAHSSDVTFETAAKSTPPPPPTPRLTKLKLARGSFHARPRHGKPKRKTGTTISYTDSIAATTTLVVFSQQTGVKHRGRCVKRTRRSHGAKCTIAKRVLTVTHQDRAGVNHLTFNPRLAPGRYRLQATPHTSTRRGRTVSIGFTVLR